MLGKIITHRVVAIVPGTEGQLLLETKGDANLTKDADYVTESNLIGRVIWHSKEGNVFAGMLTLMTDKIGFLACIVFPILLIAGLILRDCVKNIRRELQDAAQELEKQEETCPDAQQDMWETADAGETKQAFTPEDYQELCDRLRTELIEELKQGEQGALAQMGEKKE